jgi:uncharacterized glyoxalase superfamily protein PhnB
MIIPTLRYKDARAAITWLERAFGLDVRALHENEDGTIGHCELSSGDGLVMIGERRGGDQFDTGRAVLYVVTDDPDGHHDQAVAAGADILLELTDQPYGSREYAALDLEGNVWSFGTYDPRAS